MADWLEGLALLVLLAGLLAAPMLLAGVSAEGMFVVRSSVLISLIFSLLGYAIKGQWRLPPWWMLLALGIYIAAAGISTVRVGLFLAYEELFNIVIYALAFLLIVHLVNSHKRVQWLLVAVGLIGLSMGVYGVMQINGIELTPRLSSGFSRKISSFYFNQAHYGGLLALMIPMVWGFFLYATRWFPRLFWLGLFVLLSVNLLFTSSWDAMPFTFVGFALVSLVWAFERRNYLRLGLVMAVIAGGVAAGGWVFTQRPALVEQLVGQPKEVWVKYLNGTLETRLDIYEGTVKTFQESPVWGVGPFQVINHLTLYRAPTVAEGRITHKFVNYAHNDYLEVLSQVGIVGFVGWFGLILAIIFYRTKVSRLVAVGTLGGIVALLLHGLSDSNFTVIPATVLLAWCLMGLRACDTIQVVVPSGAKVGSKTTQLTAKPDEVSPSAQKEKQPARDSSSDDFEEITF